eukprot:TRINITY_DN9349_c0_g1_i3.p1 TRINITY_DN9349_c0_g1~~TRINITY_DN9349_c0_g1_i3.p1  ORF type:complete len:131 (-),score=35.07 TRINITY_DN9349_c0_g1_i3:165-557(-)
MRKTAIYEAVEGSCKLFYDLLFKDEEKKKEEGDKPKIVYHMLSIDNTGSLPKGYNLCMVGSIAADGLIHIHFKSYHGVKCYYRYGMGLAVYEVGFINTNKEYFSKGFFCDLGRAAFFADELAADLAYTQR